MYNEFHTDHVAFAEMPLAVHIENKINRHIANTSVHITKEERDAWNDKLDKSALDDIYAALNEKVDKADSSDSDNSEGDKNHYVTEGGLEEALKDYVTSNALDCKIKSLEIPTKITDLEGGASNFVTEDKLVDTLRDTKYFLRPDDELFTINGTKVSVGDTITVDDLSYRLPIATNDILGGIKLGYSDSSMPDNIPVRVDESGKAYVTVTAAQTVDLSDINTKIADLKSSVRLINVKLNSTQSGMTTSTNRISITNGVLSGTEGKPRYDIVATTDSSTAQAIFSKSYMESDSTMSYSGLSIDESGIYAGVLAVKAVPADDSMIDDQAPDEVVAGSKGTSFDSDEFETTPGEQVDSEEEQIVSENTDLIITDSVKNEVEDFLDYDEETNTSGAIYYKIDSDGNATRATIDEEANADKTEELINALNEALKALSARVVPTSKLKPPYIYNSSTDAVAASHFLVRDKSLESGGDLGEFGSDLAYLGLTKTVTIDGILLSFVGGILVSVS